MRARRSSPASTRRSRIAPGASGNVCKAQKGRVGFSFRFAASSAIVSNAFAWCFRKLDGSTWPLRVPAGHTQPSCGFPVASHRDSRTARTRGVMGITRRADAVLPRATSNAPLRPFTHVRSSQRSRKHSSGRHEAKYQALAFGKPNREQEEKHDSDGKRSGDCHQKLQPGMVR
jgi:hypothetical protein